MQIADSFVGSLREQDFRERANAVTSVDEMTADSVLKPVRDSAKELQTVLESIFFDSVLSSQAKRYLSF